MHTGKHTKGLVLSEEEFSSSKAKGTVVEVPESSVLSRAKETRSRRLGARRARVLLMLEENELQMLDLSAAADKEPLAESGGSAVERSQSAVKEMLDQAPAELQLFSSEMLGMLRQFLKPQKVVEKGAEGVMLGLPELSLEGGLLDTSGSGVDAMADQLLHHTRGGPSAADASDRMAQLARHERSSDTASGLIAAGAALDHVQESFISTMADAAVTHSFPHARVPVLADNTIDTSATGIDAQAYFVGTHKHVDDVSTGLVHLADEMSLHVKGDITIQAEEEHGTEQRVEKASKVVRAMLGVSVDKKHLGDVINPDLGSTDEYSYDAQDGYADDDKDWYVDEAEKKELRGERHLSAVRGEGEVNVLKELRKKAAAMRRVEGDVVGEEEEEVKEEEEEETFAPREKEEYRRLSRGDGVEVVRLVKLVKGAQQPVMVAKEKGSFRRLQTGDLEMMDEKSVTPVAPKAVTDLSPSIIKARDAINEMLDTTDLASSFPPSVVASLKEFMNATDKMTLQLTHTPPILNMPFPELAVESAATKSSVPELIDLNAGVQETASVEPMVKSTQGGGMPELIEVVPEARKRMLANVADLASLEMLPDVSTSAKAADTAVLEMLDPKASAPIEPKVKQQTSSELQMLEPSKTSSKVATHMSVSHAHAMPELVLVSVRSSTNPTSPTEVSLSSLVAQSTGSAVKTEMLVLDGSDAKGKDAEVANDKATKNVAASVEFVM